MKLGERIHVVPMKGTLEKGRKNAVGFGMVDQESNTLKRG